MNALPIIDFASFRSGSARGRAEVPRAIAQAAETIGFFYLANHGISQAVTDAAFAAGRRFFDLPLAAKREVSIREQRGYQAYKDVTRPGYLANLNESFFFGLDLGPDDQIGRAHV